MWTKLKKNQRGFSIIESVIALGVLAITMLGLAQMFGVATRQNSFARYNTMALSLAQEKMEFLRSEYNNELESGTASSDLTAGTHGPVTETLAAPAGSGTGDRDFEVQWDVTISGTGKTIVVSVSPVDSNVHETKTLTLTGIFIQ